MLGLKSFIARAASSRHILIGPLVLFWCPVVVGKLISVKEAHAPTDLIAFIVPAIPNTRISRLRL